MTHERTRYLIQHRISKAYIRKSVGIDERVELTTDPWKAWTWDKLEDASHDLEHNRYMPEDKDSYRVVGVIDKREVSEDEPVPEDR